MFIVILLALERFRANPKLAEISERINNFFNVVGARTIQFVLQALAVNDQEFIESSQYAAALEMRALQDQAVFDFLYSRIDPGRRTAWLAQLLDYDTPRFLAKLAQEQYRVPDSQLITERLLDVVMSTDHESQPGVFEAINQLKFGGDEGLATRYVEMLSTYLVSADQALQSIGLTALSGASFLGDEKRRKLTKEVLDWLRQPELTDKYQPSSTRAVTAGNALLNKEERNEFLHFLFDELIRKSDNPSAISFGLEQLAVLEPKYQARRTNFEDVRERYETEPNESVKTLISKGLKRIPHQSNSKTKFWNWVDSLPSDDR